MPGGKSTQNSTTQQTQNQTQSSTSNPWEAANPALQGILGQIQGGLGNTGLTSAENNAYGTLTNNANAFGSNFAPQIADYAKTLFNGGGATNNAGAVNQNYLNYRGALTGNSADASGNLSGYRGALDNSNTAAGNTYADYERRLASTANGSNIGGNSGLAPYLDTLRSDITNSTNGSFAAAGRDFSGANAMALGRGITQGLAPVIAGQYNTDVANQRGAADALYNGGNTTNAFRTANAGAGYGAGNTTGGIQANNAGNAFSGGNTNYGLLSGLQQQHLANQGAGVGVAGQALDANNAGANASLQAEAARRGIPVQALGLLAQIGIPIAGLGGTSSGTSSGTSTGNTNQTNQMSGAQQFNLIGGGVGNLLKAAAAF